MKQYRLGSRVMVVENVDDRGRVGVIACIGEGGINQSGETLQNYGVQFPGEQLRWQYDHSELALLVP